MWTFFVLATLVTEAFSFGQRSVPAKKVDGPWQVEHGEFAQLIDHNNPSLGTFQQSYWYNYHFYQGPGSPIVLFSPSHWNGTDGIGFIFNVTTMGRMAQELGGAAINIEHRYWGNSSPFDELTTENLKYLTIENAMKDLVYFANNVELPFAPNGTHPTVAPWVLHGGSYSGGIAAWIANLYPGTFWAYYISSAVMQALDPFWEYFTRIEQGMARNCSKDVAAVIDHMDDLLLHGSEQDITDLKAKFNLQSVQHNDDFVAWIGNAPGMWQLGDESDNHLFLTWCDYIENVNITIAGPDGVGAEAALDGYARWWKEVGSAMIGCTPEDNEIDCYDSHNASSTRYTDVSLGFRTDRPYTWLNCATPLGTWQTGAPAGCPSLVSRLLDDDYFHRICGLYFPPTPSGETYNQGRTVDDTNAFTGGWNPQNLSRVLFVEGEFDPWASAGVTSQFRPGGPMQSSENVTVLVLPGGHHCTEQYTPVGEGKAIEDIEETIDKAVAQIVKWAGEWPGRHE